MFYPRAPRRTLRLESMLICKSSQPRVLKDWTEKRVRWWSTVKETTEHRLPQTPTDATSTFHTDLRHLRRKEDMEDGIKTRLRSASHTSAELEVQRPAGTSGTHLPPFRPEGATDDFEVSAEGIKRAGFRPMGDMGMSTECLDETLHARREMYAEHDSCEVSSTEDDGEATVMEREEIRRPDPESCGLDELTKGGPEGCTLTKETPKTPTRPTFRETVSLSAGGRSGTAQSETMWRERFLMDDYGLWVVFEVPDGHHLQGQFFPTRRSAIPPGACVEYVAGRLVPEGHAGTENLSPTGRPAMAEATVEPVRAGTTDPTTVPPNSAKPTVSEPTETGKARDMRLMELEQELSRVKEALAKTNGGTEGESVRASPRRKLRSVRYARGVTDTEVDSACDTVVEGGTRRRGRALTDTEFSQTEYDTCIESEANGHGSASSARSVRLRRKRTEGRTSSRASSASSLKDRSEGELAELIQRMMRSSLSVIMEEKLKNLRPAEAAPVLAKHEVTAGGDNGGPPIKVETPNIRPIRDSALTREPIATKPSVTEDAPLRTSMPFTTITKFDGSYWEEFIEYFESVAMANAWGEREKLTYLLMSVEGKARAYAKSERGVPQTYENVKARLHSRYSQHEPAFAVRNQLREIKKNPGERLEDFADRLQEVAQRENLEAWERDELFYHAFISAVRGVPKMQNHIEKQYRKRRIDRMDTKLSDLLTMVREYREKSPATACPVVMANVCKPVTQRKGKLTHEDEEVAEDVSVEQDKVREEKEERKKVRKATDAKNLDYCLKEIDWVKKIIKSKKLHHGMGRGKRDNGKDGELPKPGAEQEPRNKAGLSMVAVASTDSGGESVGSEVA